MSHEVAPKDEVAYIAAVDPSGGTVDHFTLAIVHAEGEGAELSVVQDVMRGWAPSRGEQVDLEGIVAEIAGIVKQYRCEVVYGDKYSGGWVAQAFARHELRYDTDVPDKSQAYLAVEPLFAQGRIKVLNHERLLRELRLLERRPRAGGKTIVDHPRGLHDDYANAVALAAAIVVKEGGLEPPKIWGGSSPQFTQEERDEDQRIEREESARFVADEVKRTGYFFPGG